MAARMLRNCRVCGCWGADADIFGRDIEGANLRNVGSVAMYRLLYQRNQVLRVLVPFIQLTVSVDSSDLKIT